MANRFLSRKIANKIVEEVDRSQHGSKIYSGVYLAMLIIFGYPAVYQFTDGQGVTATKVVGAIISGLIALVGLSGCIVLFKKGNNKRKKG